LRELAVQIGLLVLIAIVLFAWIKGGPGERIGAAAVAVTWIACLAVLPFVPADLRPMVFMTSDIVLATSLLVAALLYPSFWMGAAMMLQAFVLAVHAFHLEDGARGFADRLTYARVINAVSYGVLIALAASTLAGWLRRRKALREVPRDTLPAQPRAA
jgi:predicted anti-sigma-YlaC factor YlaD